MIQYTPHVIRNRTGDPYTICHRDCIFGAAVVNFEQDGILERGEWWILGKKHREDGPAVIHYRDGKPINEEWWRDGKMHRDIGPADILYDKDGSVRLEIWMRDGWEYTPSAHDLLAQAAAQQREGGE